MNSQWFVIHTLSGQEQKVKNTLEKRLKTEEMEEYIHEILVPMEKVVEIRGGKKIVSNRKLCPGYVFIHMILLDDQQRIIDRPWYFIRETQGIIDFEVGETIKINDGPFLNFSGVIEEVEPERGKLKVTVNIFGRNTPVELEYWQVEKS